MAQVNGMVLDALRSNIHGELIEPEHSEYETARLIVERRHRPPTGHDRTMRVRR